MLALYKQLFAELHESQVEHCIWKNIHETPEALAGTGDIDLYISPESYEQFVTILRLNGFIKLISHKATPCVEHYYGFDAPSGKFGHLHCYFRIVTGESHIKQYIVPIEDYLPHFPNRKNQDGISEMHPVLQYKLNLFRRSIKLSCLPGALLFYRERRGYQQERLLLEQALRDHPATESRVRQTGWLAKIQTSTSVHGEIVAGIRNRIYFRHWNRFPLLATLVYRYGTILVRVAGKLRKQRKMLPIGIVVAITGPGHSTVALAMLESRISSWLGEHFTVVTVRDTRQFTPPATPNLSRAEADENDSLGDVIRRLWSSFDRHRKIKSALQQTAAGSIVIWHQQNDSIRQAAGTLPCTDSSQTAVTKFVSSTSNRLFDAKPQIDILLCLSGNSTTGIDRSADTGTDRSSRQPEESTEPSRRPIKISISPCKVASDANWKHDVWQALVAFQP